MKTPSLSYTQKYFERLGWHLKRDASSIWDGESWQLFNEQGQREEEFLEIPFLWGWWTQKALCYLDEVSSINAISQKYREADLDVRKMMMFFLFDNYYSLTPIPCPPMPWDEMVAKRPTIQDLPRNWKAWMLKKEGAERKRGFRTFHSKLAEHLEKEDQLHPRPLWTECLPNTRHTSDRTRL